MTVIAWDGKTLAADKRGTDCNFPRTVTKVRRTAAGVLIACTGSVCSDAEMMAWYEAGAVAADFPASQRDQEKCSILVAIEPGPVVRYFNGSPHGAVFEDRFFATGSGRDFALSAMYLGMRARETVEFAARFDISCGNGCDALELAP